MVERIRLEDYCERIEPGKRLAIYVLSDQQLQRHGAFGEPGQEGGGFGYIREYQDSLDKTAERLDQAGVPFVQIPFVESRDSDKRIARGIEEMKADVCGSDLGIYALGCPCCVREDMFAGEAWTKKNGIFVGTQNPGVIIPTSYLGSEHYWDDRAKQVVIID